MDAGPPAVLNGAPMPDGAVVVCPPGARYYLLTAGPTVWTSLSIAPSASRLLAALPIDAPTGSTAEVLLIDPPVVRFSRLAAVLMRFMQPIAPDENARPILDQAELDLVMLDAVAACLVHPAAAPPLARTGRKEVLDRLEGVILRTPHRPVDVTEACSAIGVAGRTLRACCHAFLGMGPSQYMLRRRMALARVALMEADAEQDSVTCIAGRFGFWELGRFAVTYRALFGESPSKTLRRPAERLLPALEGDGILGMLGPQAVPALRRAGHGERRPMQNLLGAGMPIPASGVAALAAP
jgi:AraC-like DNA-binding protein